MRIWLDLETTGLDPAKDAILEIAMLCEGHLFSKIVKFDGRDLSPFIQDMHTKNGLLSDCATYGKPLAAVEADALEWLTRFDTVPHTLAGSSVHFDLSFLRVHMPMLAKRFSHRLFDVSAIKLFCEDMGMPKLPKAEAHRAVDDIYESVNHWAVCKGWAGAYIHK